MLATRKRSFTRIGVFVLISPRPLVMLRVRLPFRLSRTTPGAPAATRASASCCRAARVWVPFGVAAAVPYVAFVLAWAAVFRTLAHVRWTLVFPLFTGLSGEIATPLTSADLHEAAVLALPLGALFLAEAALGPAARRRSPLVAVAAATAGMAWPRFSPLHLAGAIGLLALSASRAALLSRGAAVRSAKRTRPGRLPALAAAGALQIVVAGVAILGAGPFLLDGAFGPVFHWDDTASRALADAVRARVPAGGELLVYDSHQAVYPLTGTRAPGNLYVNPWFWYCLKRDGGDDRLVAALEARPGLPVLYREPVADVGAVRATRTYAFLASHTAPDGAAPGAAAWRRVAPTP